MNSLKLKKRKREKHEICQAVQQNNLNFDGRNYVKSRGIARPKIVKLNDIDRVK